MRTIFILLFITIHSCIAKGQSITFDYDAAGNRIKRYSISTPDLIPYVQMDNVSFNGVFTRPFVITIWNDRAGTTVQNPVTFRIYKPTLNATIALTGISPSQWTVSTTTTYYLLTKINTVSYPSTGYEIAGTLSLPAATASGNYNFRIFIQDSSGGEVEADYSNNETIIRIFK